MSKDAIKTVKVKLLKDHQHGKMRHSAGMEIEVPQQDAEWLKNLKIAEDAQASVAAAKLVEEK